MINESYYWRREVSKLSSKIKNRISYKRPWTDATHGAFEKEVMIGFYMIRKLIEANKLTNKIVSTKIDGRKYSNIGKNVTIQNNHRFQEFFDLEKSIAAKFDLTFLINQIIHSYIFAPSFALAKSYLDQLPDDKELSKDEIDEMLKSQELELTSILFCSRERRNEFLFEIEILTIVDLFEKVGSCVVTTIHRTFNNKRNDYDVYQTDEEVPIPPDIEELIKLHEKK
ncbi:MAG: hypothetical protein JNK00_13090 [Flavipsychrobacter sp.]|nr:hypothetical protein [Flavipsychrobacter sp.]